MFVRKQRLRCQHPAAMMICTKRCFRHLCEVSIEEHHFRMHVVELDEVVVVEVVAGHDYAIAVAADQELHGFDCLVAGESSPQPVATTTWRWTLRSSVSVCLRMVP